MSGASGSPEIAGSPILDKIKKQELIKPEDLIRADREKALQEAKNMNKVQREEMRKHLDEYRDKKAEDLKKPESAEVDMTLEEIEEELMKEEVPVNVVEELPMTPEQAERKADLKNLQKQTEGFMAKFQENIIDFIPLPILKWLQESIFKGMFGKVLEPMIKQKELFGRMQDILGEDKVKKTDQDKEFMKQLELKYIELPTPETGVKVDFDPFCIKRISEAKKLNKPAYTLKDIVDVEMPEERDAKEAARKKVLDERTEKTEKDAEKGKESKEKEKIDEKSERRKQMEGDPSLRNAVYSYALGRAFQKHFDLGAANPSPSIIGNEERMGKDLKIREKGDTNNPVRDGFHRQVVQKIKEKLEEEDFGEATVGMELDNGVLEETEGTNWFYDGNLIENFDPVGHPDNAVMKLLSLDVDSVSMNNTAKTTLKMLQRDLKTYLDEYIGPDETAPVIAEPEAIAAAPVEPAPVAPAATAATPPTTPPTATV